MSRSAKRVAFVCVLLAPLLSLPLLAQTYAVGSSPVGVASAGANIWVANSGDNTVTKLLASTGAIVGTYPAGAGPYGLVSAGANIWVTDIKGATVTKLLASTGVTVGTYAVGPSPDGIAFDGINIWVTNSGSNTVTKLLASTGATVGTYTVGSTPTGITFDGTNIWVANNGSANVTKLLASTGATVGTYTLGLGSFNNAFPFAMAFDGTYIWLTLPGAFDVTKLLASSGEKVSVFSVRGAEPVAIVFDGTNMWISDGHDYTVTELTSTGATLGVYNTLQGVPEGIAFDGSSIWVANNPDLSNIYGYSGWITKISPSDQQPPLISGIFPIDSTASRIQPGEWVSIWGSNMANATAVWNSDFPTSLNGTSVTVDGKFAYLSFVSFGQINLQVPDDTVTGPVVVDVSTASGTASLTVTLGPISPSFCLLDATHVAGIILRPDGSGAYDGGTYDILGPTGTSLGYPTVAAKPGDSVELFGVGFGPTTPAIPIGQAYSGAAPTTNAVKLLISGAGATTTLIPPFAGLSSAGLYQFNVIIPAGLGTGGLQLTANVGGFQTQPGVVIAVQ